MANGLQYSDGQHATIQCHNQFAKYTVTYSEKEKKAPLAPHEEGIRWKILAIMRCDKIYKMGNAGEPVFLVWSEHITDWVSWVSNDQAEPAIKYPRWKFAKEFNVKGIMSTEIVPLSEDGRLNKTCALQAFQPDGPEGPEKRQDAGSSEAGALERGQ